jgi:integrating conjugative element protein (TIGR03752 family)
LQASAQVAQNPPPVKPVYTVPENATLLDSTAFTALIGRIPLRGRVQDPWPFKLITGADNLAANGLEIAEVAGMVWSGTAVGDWTLSCVRGQVTSVTFVFNDGTIRTLTPASSGPDTGAAVNEGVTSDRGLGWISDRFGAPCVSGERITNAPEFLMQRAGLLALQGGADAFAERETRTIVSGQTGTATDFVSGDTARFILGRTLSGGAEEINKWLLERQQQSFDAVFVRAGAEIAINVTQALKIDYDPQGRKLRYAQELDFHRRSRLD